MKFARACMCVCFTNTFFTGGSAPRYPPAYSFTTGFSICHSFLDFLYIGFFAPFGEIDCPGGR